MKCRYVIQCVACSKTMSVPLLSDPKVCSENCKVRMDFRNEAMTLEDQLRLETKKRDRQLRKQRKIERLNMKILEARSTTKKKRSTSLREANQRIEKLEARLKLKVSGTNVVTRPYNDFYDSKVWKELRYRVIRTYGRNCAACKSTQGQMHVDHIKPRSKYPELALDFSNLQVLCAVCNVGKSNSYNDDWRQ